MKLLKFLLIIALISTSYAQTTKFDLTTQVKNQLPIVNGGTNANNAPAALSNLGAAPAFALTTTGASGAATYSGNVINIPQYQAALGFTPYNATNPAGYITSGSLSTYLLNSTAASTYAPIFALTTTGDTGPATYSGNVLNIPQYTGGSYLPLSGGTLTGALNGTSASFSDHVNTTNGFQVGGVALSASNLSNGVSGTGAVCLASGSACTSSISAVTSVGVASSTATQLTVSGSPITSNGTIYLGLNLTGTEAKVVTASAAGTATHCANWNSSGGIGDSGYACSTMTTPLTCNSNGCYRISSDGLVEEWVYGVSLENNSPTTIFLPTSIPNTVIGIQCSDNGGRVQGGNNQPVGANVAGVVAPYSYFYANTPATSVSASCYITGK